MANNNEELNKLLIYIQKIRLEEDKRIITTKLNENKKEDKLGTTWDKFKIGLSNFKKSVVSSVGSYDSKNKEINDELSRFNSKNNDVIDEETAKGILIKLNENDNNALTKLMFNLNVALDNEYKYIYNEEGLKLASKFLNNDEYYLSKLRLEVERYYKVIADKSLSNLQKGVLVGVTLASLVAITLIPVAGVGGLAASGASTTAGLAAIGFGDMQLGIGMLALSTALLGTALIGGTYLAMKQYNEHEVKKEFRKLDADQVALQLSIQCLIIRHLKSKLDSEVFKDRLDSILKEVNVLKSDLDFMLFVEKHESFKNKPKLKVFYGFDKVLVDILDI